MVLGESYDAKVPKDKLGGCGITGEKTLEIEAAAAWKLALEMQDTDTGRRQETHTTIRCSPVRKHYRLCNL